MMDEKEWQDLLTAKSQPYRSFDTLLRTILTSTRKTIVARITLNAICCGWTRTFKRGSATLAAPISPK